MKANHEKDFKCVIGYQEVILQPGQFIFGIKKAAKETGLSVQNIRTCIKFLKKYQNLTLKSTNKFSIISIINWGTYQQQECETNKQTNTRVTHAQHTPNYIQEQKNKRKELYCRVAEYLNKKTGKHYKADSKGIIKLINARSAEGFQPEDFKTVIDNKTAQWKGDIENNKYLRPETLFGTKFESYLNETPVNGAKLTEKEILEKYGL